MKNPYSVIKVSLPNGAPRFQIYYSKGGQNYHFDTFNVEVVANDFVKLLNQANRRRTKKKRK